MSYLSFTAGMPTRSRRSLSLSTFTDGCCLVISFPAGSGGEIHDAGDSTGCCRG